MATIPSVLGIARRIGRSPQLNQLGQLLSTLPSLQQPHSQDTILHDAAASCNAVRGFSTSPQPEPAPASSAPSFAAPAAYTAGQPTPLTHPELLKVGEVTPGISAKEYEQRRRALLQGLAPGTLVIVPSNNTQYMAGIIPYPYRQDPDFFYLTGMTQHGVLMLQAPSTPGSSDYRYVLFIEQPNEERARWDGARVDKIAATRHFGAHEVYHMQEMPRVLLQALKASPEVLYDMDRQAATAFYAATIARVLQQAQGSGRLAPLRPRLHEQRLVKSSAEAAMMRRSAQLSAAALKRCMATSGPGVAEYQVAATFEYLCKANGAQRMAYPPVVAGGPDACTIHYGRNDKVLRHGQLLLMDAGCELHGYVSDVSRTWPVSGKYSEAQRDVYCAVLEAHRRCVAACKPGASIRELHSLSIQVLSEGLRQMGVVRGMAAAEIARSRYHEFYWHSVGHWLGVDTHDTALIAHDRPLRPGMVITIEPGLYIPDSDRYGALRGIGVRIEDDVLLTDSGCEVLSRDAPYEPEEVEALAGSAAPKAPPPKTGCCGGGANKTSSCACG